MKSGNVIRLKNITAYEIKTNGIYFTSISFKWDNMFLWFFKKSGEIPLVQTFNLSQIEAITKS
jgi:hypothetical protein